MEAVQKTFMDFMRAVIEEAAEAGAQKAIEKFQDEHLLPRQVEKSIQYDRREVFTLYLRDSRFKKISSTTLLNWENAGRVKNYGTERHKKYLESELLDAMLHKGKRYENLHSSTNLYTT